MAVLLLGAFVLILVALIVLIVSVIGIERSMVGQYEDLRGAVAQLGVDLGEAVARVEAKIDSLGEPDPDLTADIAAIKEASAKLDALAADPVPEPTPEPGPTPSDGGGTDPLA